MAVARCWFRLASPVCCCESPTSPSVERERVMATDWLTDTRLIMAFWAAVGLIALGYGYRRRNRPPSIDRQISIVSAAVGAVLLILGIQAARYAVFQQKAIAGR